jgi:DNA-binding MarR family transcriptional regulator
MGRQLDWRDESEENDIHRQVAAIRRFNRYYFERMAFLRETSKGRGLRPAEIRVIRLLGEAPGGMPAAAIAWRIGMDAGALCRLLAGLKASRIVSIDRDPRDGRLRIFSLAANGRQIHRGLLYSAQNALQEMLRYMKLEDRRALVAAMRAIEDALSRAPRFVVDPFPI